MSASPSREESGHCVNDIPFGKTIVKDLKVGAKPFLININGFDQNSQFCQFYEWEIHKSYLVSHVIVESII